MLSHKSIEVIWETGTAVANTSNESWSMWGAPSPCPCPSPSFLNLLYSLGAADERRFRHSEQNEHYFTTHCRPSLCFALLLNLYFGFKTSTGAAGKEDKPLIGGDVTTLSPYGARNSAELLSNLHNMLGIWGCCFSGENSSPYTLRLLFWHAVCKWHLQHPCSTLTFGTSRATRRKSNVSVLLLWDTPFGLEFHLL